MYDFGDGRGEGRSHANILLADQDIASLALLTNAPYYYLLYTLWALELSPVLVSLVIDITTLAIPFALFRPLHAHSATAPVKSANQAVARDWQIDLLTAALAAVVYAMTFYLTYLLSDFSVFLVTHFDYIPSFERLHNSTLMTLLQSYMFNGIAAMLFMFRPAMAAVGAPKMTKKLKTRKFKPETASLMETIAYNLGMSEAGPSHRAEVLGKRALVLVAGTLANTFVRVFGTVAGTDVVGSLGYGGLWAAANLLVAVAYGFLGQE